MSAKPKVRTHLYSSLPYHPPLGLPMRWQDDITGELPRAVKSYQSHMLGRVPLSQHRFELVRAYMEYLINAPCWRDLDGDTHLKSYRRTIQEVKTPAELAVWIESLLAIGIDPL